MGRRPIYTTDEERKEAQRKHALKYYYRRKALRAAQHEHNETNTDNEERINITVNVHSKRLGDIAEDIQYKHTPTGSLMKVRTKNRNGNN